MAEHKIPEREQIPEQYTWDLRDIFPSDQAWSEEYQAMAEIPGQLQSFKGRLGESAEQLLAYMQLSDSVALRLEKLLGYASCKADQDLANGFYKDMRGKAMNRWVEIASASAFADPEILAISDDVLDSFYALKPQLETYRRSLYRLRRRKEHILSANEERLLAAAGEMADGPDSIGGALRNADMSFSPAVDSQGQAHLLSSGTLGLLLESPDRVLRKNAFINLYERYDQVKNTIAATLDAQFKQLNFFARARSYPSTLAASLDVTEVPEKVYMDLIAAVNKGLPSMYRYVRLRKRALGLDELHMYDVHTPIVPGFAKSISYEEAREQVLAALSVLGEDYVQLLRKGLDSRWIDVYENKGKRSGAYSTDLSHPHPYVLLNHSDNLDSMFTLAHEMGHALHSYHSSAAQPMCTSDYVIFVAEVASTCNEILLMRWLLDRCQDKQERAYLIDHFLDQFKSTVYRQTMFAEFELEMGRMSWEGQTLTAEALQEKYLALNGKYFGPDMVNDEQIGLEWARIPHFFYNYYVFQYATGFSAAAAIAQRILTEGESAVKDYKRFLSSGSSADPISLLKLAGVDMASPQPVASALQLFDELVQELESLI